MKPISIYKFETSHNPAKRGVRWLLECIIPCCLAFVAFQYIAYSFPVILLEHYHIKGLDLHTSLDFKIPLVSWFVYFYTPSVMVWTIMPFIVYGLYGRKRFYQYFAASIVFSIVCFITYISLPTAAFLQSDQVVNHGIHESNDNLSFTDLLLFKTYQSAAPYGEAPSGHWGNSILFFLACAKPWKSREKRSRAQKTVFGVWTIYAILVCLATMFLKQHNIVDGPITIVLVATIWWCMSKSAWPNRFGKFFWSINVKLGIEHPTASIHALEYNKHSGVVDEVKKWGVWILLIVSILVLFYLIIAIWNSTLGGFLHFKLLPFVFVGYHLPSYDANGIPFVGESWPVYWGQ